MKLITFLLSILLLTTPLFPQTPLSVEDVGTSLKKAVYIDNITVNPNTKTVTIRTFISYQDENGNEVKRDRGETIVLQDREDDPNTEVNEAKTEYTDFMKGLGIEYEKVVEVIKGVIGG